MKKPLEQTHSIVGTGTNDRMFNNHLSSLSCEHTVGDNMKIRRFVILLFLIVVVGMSVSADQQPVHDQSINDVLAEIRRELLETTI